MAKAKTKDPEDIIKVGDTVLITKGTSNWNAEMDKWVGKKVVVTKLYGKDIIIFKDCGAWSWQRSCGHFEKIKPHKDNYEIF